MDKHPKFEIIEPEQITSALLLNSPHSGSLYPEHFLAQTHLTKEQLRCGEDTAIDGLFSKAVPNGACFMSAFFPRTFVDVNREPYELDQNMFEGKLPSFANTKSVRVTSGLGSVPRITAQNTKIYQHKFPVKDGLERIEHYHQPYHQALAALIERVHKRQGFSILLDCHSMPSTIESSSLGDKTVKDIILGDRFGTSCSPVLVDVFEVEAKKCGLNVVRNAPYAGGYITEHYGSPKTQNHALQIEINRALYMNEQTLKLTSNFTKLQADLTRIIGVVNELHAADLAPFSKAAE